MAGPLKCAKTTAAMQPNLCLFYIKTESFKFGSIGLFYRGERGGRASLAEPHEWRVSGRLGRSKIRPLLPGASPSRPHPQNLAADGKAWAEQNNPVVTLDLAAQGK
jgi:hypothetical protein